VRSLTFYRVILGQTAVDALTSLWDDLEITILPNTIDMQNTHNGYADYSEAE
jgi:hypothetical protein